MRSVILAVAVLAVCTGALAQRVSNVTGRVLMTACTGKSIEACDSYVDGFGDAIFAEGKDHALACIPRASTGTELRDVLVTYLKAHPEVQNEKGYDIARKAFAKAYPCTK